MSQKIRKLIGLLDCNNFYVSCERVFRPELEKRPVVVLSNNDGCIIARSNEVKALGVPMGAPFFKVRSLLDAHQATVFSSNFALYGDMSHRVMSIVESLAPKSEVYSIDETFIDFTGISDPNDLAQEIQYQILKQVGIPTCLGISFTKTLAKVANRIAKKNPIYQGVYSLLTEKDIDAALTIIPPADVWGVGRKSADKLTEAGIVTALQLKNTDIKWMRQYFTVVGERIVLELNGISCLELDDIIDARKSIQVTRSFTGGISSFDALREKIASFATRAGEKMRREGLATQLLSVYIRTNKYQDHIQQYANRVNYHLPFPSNDDATLIKAATTLLQSLYKEGFSYHKAGVMVHALSSIKDNEPVQLNLFGPPVEMGEKAKDLMKAVDLLNHKYGRGTLKMAACGVGHKTNNKNEKNNKSPAYTTKWEDIPTVS